MFHLTLPWWEFALRAIVVYLFLYVMLRITGRRQVGQLSPFDLILLLIISNAVQNSMNAGDNSLLGGLISAAVLVLLNWGLSYLTYRSKKWERIIEGHPEILVHNGKIYPAALRREKISQDELMAILRRNGIFGIADVRYAILETTGSVSVIPMAEKKTHPEESLQDALPKS